ncbi:uncharacterized protein LOC100900450 [Galendromus occidentalis]|uniref:Uncharacterized protein LOC100900450 n=1 Tax=Galendromus occidentalis TaxID=34638 RepID=A0AAJ6VXA2_9ACAR|nr:uncharacterized protein LOC100906193 [Galendromus occidentalis]XP_003743157.1 uncharacterized protein LOC100900450 [Galendromus occidentalis]
MRNMQDVPRRSSKSADTPLPAFRIEETPPVHHFGCDFTGPVRYKKNSGEIGKGYILLFTCAVTRAVHQELTTDLSTVEVLEALKKFLNRLRSVRTITSDNGLSFQRASEELKLIHENVKNGEIRRRISDLMIDWKFIVPMARNFGAFYERQIQTIKRPFRKILASAVPHFRDLEIILSGIEAMVSSRPMTTIASGADEIEALSPADHLSGYRGRTIIPEHISEPSKASDADKIVFSRRWKYQQRILSSYWKRYHDEYLQYLKTAHKQTPVAARPLKIDEVCLLKGESYKRAFWPLCKVIALPDNTSPENARSCTIRTAEGQVFHRPIHKLYPLEAQD